jgi:hypothetical protein
MTRSGSLSRLAAAQPGQLGTIVGTVTDDTGGVTPGVAVTITSRASASARQLRLQ